MMNLYSIGINSMMVYMYTSKKIIICKFNLKNQCKFGEKCKFQHIGIKELNDILAKFEDHKQENVLVKLNLKKSL
jgi:hypothetical protein